MAIPMPPVINKGGEDVDDQRREPVTAVLPQMKDRRVPKPAIPSLAGENSDPELYRVNQNYSAPPRVHPWKFHSGPQPFCQNTTGRDSEDDKHIHAPIIISQPILC